jgi:uncharacterized protein YkwD
MKTTLRTQLSLLFVVSLVGACAQAPVSTPAPVNAPAAVAPTRAPARATVPAPTPAPAIVAVAPAVAPAPSPAASALHSEYEAFFDEAVQLINQYRARKNLSTLTRDSRLDSLASAHSRNMAAKDDLSHDGFNERFNQANMHSCAENVAWNQITASELVNDWIASPVHDKNLLKPNVTKVGMGRAKGYTAYFVCQP